MNILNLSSANANTPVNLVSQIGKRSTSTRFESTVFNISAHVLGVILLTALAQISIPLSFTPVPVTGQTFGVALVALLWGRNRGTLIFANYFILGAFFHLPVFATAAKWGPTAGYIMGMFLATFVMGTLADRGWNRSLLRCYFAAAIGSLITFTCGLLVLRNFVPKEGLLLAGLWPFLPGDFVKSILAAGIVSKLSQRQ